MAVVRPANYIRKESNLKLFSNEKNDFYLKKKCQNYCFCDRRRSCECVCVCCRMRI